jgi:hypothetical protein
MILERYEDDDVGVKKDVEEKDNSEQLHDILTTDELGSTAMDDEKDCLERNEEISMSNRDHIEQQYEVMGGVIINKEEDRDRDREEVPSVTAACYQDLVSFTEAEMLSIANTFPLFSSFLNNPITLSILAYLPSTDLIKLAQVSHGFLNASLTPLLWKELLQRDFKLTLLELGSYATK